MQLKDLCRCASWNKKKILLNLMREVLSWQLGDGEVDITEFDITESDVTFFQEIDITESDVTKKGN